MRQVKIIQGDALTVLKTLQSASIHCCVTSPPFFALRDYQITGQLGMESNPDCLGWATGDHCGECYVCRLVSVFRELQRVLLADGTCFLNLGDSYNGSGKATGRTWENGKIPNMSHKQHSNLGSLVASRTNVDGLKPKDLIGIPWRVALALQADGWWLRNDIIWAKKNGLPESVADRFTRSHEYIFLLTKSKKYYFDMEAVMEEACYDGRKDTRHNGSPKYSESTQTANTNGCERWPTTKDGKRMRQPRDVWHLPASQSTGSHYAAFPQVLPEICIKAGCPPGGTVIDPFGGSGTTGVVATRLGRDAVLIDINPNDIKNSRKRILDDAPLLNTVEIITKEEP